MKKERYLPSKKANSGSVNMIISQSHVEMLIITTLTSLLLSLMLTGLPRILLLTILRASPSSSLSFRPLSPPGESFLDEARGGGVLAHPRGKSDGKADPRDSTKSQSSWSRV